MMFQVGLVVFAAFAMARTLKQYRKQRVSLHWFLLWSGLWVLVIGVALLPETADAVAKLVGVGRGADLAVYIAVVVLAYAVFRQFVRQSETDRAITQLVRRIAVNDVKHPKK